MLAAVRGCGYDVLIIAPTETHVNGFKYNCSFAKHKKN